MSDVCSTPLFRFCFLVFLFYEKTKGFGTSTDGVHWVARPPANLQSGGNLKANITAHGFEIGGVAPLLDPVTNQTKWYAFACLARQELPAAIEGRVGCFTFVADNPSGPYELASRNYAFLAYGQRGNDPEYAYYTRYYYGTEQHGTPADASSYNDTAARRNAKSGVLDGRGIGKDVVKKPAGSNGVLLVNYQVYNRAHWKHEPGVRAYMSTLKKLVLDQDDGTLRMVWWPANDRLKNASSCSNHSSIPVTYTATAGNRVHAQRNAATDVRTTAAALPRDVSLNGGSTTATAILPVALQLDGQKGSIVEGNVVWGSSGGFCFPYHAEGEGGSRTGTAFKAAFIVFEDSTRGIASTGESTSAACSGVGSAGGALASGGITPLFYCNDTFGITAAAPEPTRGLKLATGMHAAFKFMFRQGMYDVYINDVFILSYALPIQPQDEQALLITGSFAAASPLQSWTLNL